MPASVAAAVTSLQQVLGGEDVLAVLDVEVFHRNQFHFAYSVEDTSPKDLKCDETYPSRNISEHVIFALGV
jgi:hypothetical protein